MPRPIVRRTALAAVAFALTWAVSASGDPADLDTALGEIEILEAHIAPDGGRVAFITRRNDFAHDREAFAVWVTGASAPVVLADAGTYGALRWSPDGRLLSLLAAADPGEAAQLVVLEPAAGAVPRAVTGADRFADGIELYDWLPDGSGFVAVATLPPEETPGDRRRRLELYGDVRRFPAPSSKPSFFRVALDGMTVDRLGEAPFDQPETLAVSPDGAWVAASGSAEAQTTAGTELVLLPLGAPGRVARRFPNDVWEESLAWSGRELFVAGPGERRDGVQHNTEGRLYRLGEPERLVRLHPELPGYVKQLVPLPGGGLLLTDNLSTRMRILRVQPGADPVTLLDHRGWIFNLSASRDGGTVAFVAADATHYPEVYVARGDLTGIRPVTQLNEALTRAPLPEVETFIWDDGAGGTVEGALFWPPGRKGEKGLPLIVDLHGGPFSVARTEAVSLAGSFLSYPALLAARGFLVLNPNYRGSAGRGDAFTQGIEGHHCSRPSEDVIRGVESLVARGQADRGRLGLMGYSGGGGLSKCLIGRTRLFRAVATGSGVWNDIATFTSKRGALWTESFYPGSSPWTDFPLWWKESPMSGLDQVETPTLILAGERDGDAPRQADELYRGLLRRGVPTELLLFPGEGHVFQRPSHKRTKMRAEISWLELHLLGTPRGAAGGIGPDPLPQKGV